jgi:hypothetical protein
MNTKFVQTRLTFALLAAVGLAFSGCNLNFSMVDGYMFTNTGQTAQSTEEGKFSEGINAIDVVNQFGNVKIELAVGEPGWKWDSKVWADSQEWADLLIYELAMDVQTNGQTQTLHVVLPEPTSDLNGIESNLTLMLPPDVKVNLRNSHGNVSAAKIYADVSLENSHGNVDLNELHGIVNAKNSHGDLVANNIGEAKIEVNHGKTDVLSATGDIRIASSHGNITARQISGGLLVDASHAGITVDQVDSYGDFKTTHGDIDASNLRGDVKAQNSHGSTKISTFGENVSVQASHGRIDLSMMSSNFNSIDVETTHESIKLKLPSSANPDIDMETSHGETKSEFGSDSRSSQKVKLRSTHGDIRVTKHESAVEAVQ